MESSLIVLPSKVLLNPRENWRSRLGILSVTLRVQDHIDLNIFAIWILNLELYISEELEGSFFFFRDKLGEFEGKAKLDEGQLSFGRTWKVSHNFACQGREALLLVCLINNIYVKCMHSFECVCVYIYEDWGNWSLYFYAAPR